MAIDTSLPKLKSHCFQWLHKIFR